MQVVKVGPDEWATVSADEWAARVNEWVDAWTTTRRALFRKHPGPHALGLLANVRHPTTNLPTYTGCFVCGIPVDAIQDRLPL